MDGRKDTAVEALLEHLIEHGPGDIATVFGRAFELAMQIERERFLRAGPYERTDRAPGLCQRLQAQAHRHAGRHCHRRRSQDRRP